MEFYIKPLGISIRLCIFALVSSFQKDSDVEVTYGFRFCNIASMMAENFTLPYIHFR